MARYPDAEVILQAADRWRDRCLLADGSILSEDEIWTLEHANELDRYFLQRLDTGEGDFFTKLEAQLTPASPGAKKLAAEMLWVMYLIVSDGAMGAELKRFQIRKVWAFSDEELPEDHPMLGRPLESGVAHTGTAYHTHGRSTVVGPKWGCQSP